MGGGRGRGGRSRTQRKHFRQNRENVWKRSKTDPSSDSATGPSSGPWQPFATQNPAFDEYYKEQGIVAPEEWDAFMEVLRKPLPAAFRINSSSQFCGDIRSQLENDFMISLQAEFTEGDELVPIRPLPWYPENLAWHSNFSRMQLRKNQTLERFHEFLKLENEIGNITRQEAVSMVPPLFLDVHPDHFVLDMCAAPGSKTFQLLEIIHKSVEPGSLPNGMVIANDLDVQRCNLLIHQTKRMCTANLIVTNHEAQQFPSCRLKKRCNEIGSELSMNQIIFDRVLCDVPCSGDGTLRKAPDIWRKWSPGMGNGLHSLQLKIAMQGISLLKVGGRMVYSTCSMNPVENEAVVAEILRKSGGAVELLDVSGELPQLVRRQGLKKWKVHDRGDSLTSYRDVPRFRRSVIVPGMFPSGRYYAPRTELGDIAENKVQLVEDSVVNTEELDEEVCDLPLDRCMRILPHDQNTGAFFIAVLHKLSPLPAMQEKTTSMQSGNGEPQEDSLGEVTGGVNGSEVNPTDVACEADVNDGELTGDVNGSEVNPTDVAYEADVNDGDEPDASVTEPDASEEQHKEAESKESLVTDDKETNPGKVGGKRKLQMQGKWRGVDPVVFFKDETTISSIKTFFGIDESFPFGDHLVTRNADTVHVKRIYYVSKPVKDALELNFRVGQQLKITSIGLKMFERQSAREGSTVPCAFRISSEGLPLILPYITKQILRASPADFKHLLQYKTIKFADFVDAEFGEKASNLMLGYCVIILGKGEKVSSDHIEVTESTIAIGCWKGRGSLTVMVTATDCQELLARLAARNEIEKESLNQEDNETDDMKEDKPTGEADETERAENEDVPSFATESS